MIYSNKKKSKAHFHMQIMTNHNISKNVNNNSFKLNDIQFKSRENMSRTKNI